MPGHWKEWEKAKKDIRVDDAAKSLAVDEALSILRGAQTASKDNPNAMRCSVCGGVKFKPREKGKQWVCRACGQDMQKSPEAH